MIVLRASHTVALACLLGACGELPGESLGTYKVTMTLEENTCGEVAVFSLDKSRYAVELRSDTRYAYWRIPGQTPIQGSYDDPNYVFDFSAVVASAGPDAGANGCRLQQRDQVSVKLREVKADDDDDKDAGEAEDADDSDKADDPDDASEPEADAEADDEPQDAGSDDPSNMLDSGVPGDAGHVLQGEHVMTIAAEPGTDCRRDALQPQGPFERLPCKVRYQLHGVPTKPF